MNVTSKRGSWDCLRFIALAFVPFILSLVAVAAWAQTGFVNNLISGDDGLRPYAFGGLSVSAGAGYSPIAGTGGVGLSMNKIHAMTLAEFSADDAHKADSNTGHDMYFQARAFYRTERGWYLGGGTQWNNLTTIRYSKISWKPTFGAGKDVMHEDFSFRAQIVYVLPGSDHLNAVQGPECGLWLPSPETKRHVFYHQTVGIYEFHQTSVPGNDGTNVRGISKFSSSTLLYRF
jgi:hypothetical protein